MTQRADRLYVADTSLLEQWHPTRNLPLTPVTTTLGSGRKVWWVCADGHEWQAVVKNRARGAGCPVRARQRVLVGVNDFATTHPDLVTQWHPTKNGELAPTMVTSGTKRKVWWSHHGHEWTSMVKHRVAGVGCGVCRGTQIQVGVNDLATTHPHLAKQWHPTRNGDLRPQDVYGGSERKAWWSDHGHEWSASIKNRAGNRAVGCAVCRGKAVQAGVNDLESQAPTLALEWHPTRNGTLAPTEVTLFSHQMVWWLCAAGHEWQGRPHDRWDDGVVACTECTGAGRSKVAERFLRHLGTALGVDIELERRIAVTWSRRGANFPATVDGHGELNGLRFAVEYDGPHHQYTQEIDLRKTTALLRSNDVDVVVRVRSSGLDLLPHADPAHLQFQHEARGLVQLAQSVAASLRDFCVSCESKGDHNQGLA